MLKTKLILAIVADALRIQAVLLQVGSPLILKT
jgi:hypothetical protein